MRTFFHVAAPLFTLLGVLFSAWGTYRLMLSYHPFPPKGRDFWKSVGRVSWLSLEDRFRPIINRFIELRTRLKGLNPIPVTAKKNESKAGEYINVIAAIGKREEKMPDAVAGLYLLFVGFVFQALGSGFWCVDSILDYVPRR